MGEIAKPTKERLLACVGPSPGSSDVIRTVKSMADRLHAKWYAVYVKTPRMVRLPEADQNRALQNLQLAEQLGAETFTLFSRNLAEKIGDFARRHNITKIIAGKPSHCRWQDMLFGSEVDGLVRLSGEVDVTFTTGEPGEANGLPVPVKPKGIGFRDFGMGLIYFILATGLSFLIHPYLELSNLIMVYLVGVMVTAIHCGRGPAILNSALSVVSFHFFFVPIRYSFTLVETHYIFTFAVMFLVALVISHLTILLRQQAEAARLQERQTAAMHSLSQQLAHTRGVEKILQVAVKQILEIFESQGVALLPDEKGKLYPAAGDLTAVFHQGLDKELSIAQWTLRTGQMGGWGTKIAPDSPILFVPLLAPTAVIGVLALRLRDPESELWLLPEHLRLRLLESLVKQVALALEVERLGKTAEEAQLAAGTRPPC